MTDHFYNDHSLRAEALVRGWVTLSALAVAVSTTALRSEDSSGAEIARTTLSAIPSLLITSAGNYGHGNPGIDVIVVLLRVASVMMLVGLVAAGLVALQWLSTVSLLGAHAAGRAAAGWLLVAATAVWVAAAALIEDPAGTTTGEAVSNGRYEGLSVTPGIVMPLFVALLLLARPSVAPWPRRRR